jgi:hypothetical protein
MFNFHLNKNNWRPLGSRVLSRLVLFIVTMFVTMSCGKVADLSAGSGLTTVLAIQTATLTGIQVGEVSTGISTTGGSAPLSFAVVSGELPSGLKLDASAGILSGTIPASFGGYTYGFSVTVTDAAGLTANRTFTGKIASGGAVFTVHTETLTQITSGITYNYKLAVTGGSLPYTFSVSSGGLPDGLSLNASSGTISGTPAPSTSNQAYAFSITATDSSGTNATRTYVGRVSTGSNASLSIVTSTIPTPAAGTVFQAAIAASGGSTPYNFSISSGGLPAGLSLNASSGLITGTVSSSAQGSVYLFTVTCADFAGLTASRTYSGFVSSYTLSMVPAALQSATPGAPYSSVISTVGGQSPYTYTITSGVLPSGLSLDGNTGAISGTVASAESGLTKAFTIRSIDANGVQTSTGYSLVTSAYAVSMTTASLIDGTEGSTYTNAATGLAAAGGTAPYTYSYVGTLPTGVGLTSAGAFFGTPASGTGAIGAGTTYTIYVTATDAAGRNSAQKTLSLVIVITAPVVDALTPTNATLGASYNYTITGSGGRAPYTFALISGSVPTGLTMASTGTISGTTTGSAACPANQFSVRITDNLGQSSAIVTKCITTVSGVSVSNIGFATVLVGVNYSATVFASGGTAPYTFSSSGLPIGVSLNSSTGGLSGFTNAANGDYPVFFTVTDSSTPTLTSTRNYTFSVRDPLAVTAAVLPRAGTGIPYNAGAGYPLASTGGQPPFTYSVVSGSLPSGLTISSAGVISGAPAFNTAANGGTYTFGVRASDSLGLTSSTTTFSMYVTVAPKIDMISNALPIAVVNAGYAFDVPRIGGVNRFNGSEIATRLVWSMTGSLPTGLTFSTTSGRIYGTPTTNAGSPYSLTVTVTDQHGLSGSKALSLTVNSASKTLDLKTARYSDPCLGTTNCDPRGQAIAKLTGNSQQFLVSARNDTTPRSLQIAKIDTTGRVPVANSNVTSINVPLPMNIGSLAYIRIADLDQDGILDIVFTDNTTKQLCAVWGSATVNTFGMPNGFSGANTDCWPIPVGGFAGNFPYPFVIKNNLRPDPTNFGKQDIVVSSTSSSSSNTVFVLRNNCAAGGNCSTALQRATLFGGYIAPTGNVTNASTVISGVASTAGVIAGMPIVGRGIPVGAVVASFVLNTSITMNVAATLTTAGAKLSLPSAVSVAGTVVAGSPTWTTANTTGITPGQLVSNANFPLGTTVVSVVTNTSVTVSNNSTGSGAVTISVFGPVAFTPTLLTAANSTMRDTYAIAVGHFNSTAPNPPTTYAVNSATCPAIAVGGFQTSNTANGYIYMMKQTFSGGVCQGDFTIHTSSDEMFASGGSPWMSGLLAADFNNDGITDLAAGVSTAVNANSASVRVYLLPGSSSTFTGATTISPQLQSRGTAIVGANRLEAYCLDGTNNCSYPSLLVTCNREQIIGASTNYGCLSILPNQCSTPGCTTPFENSTPAYRIDYPAPPGQTMEPILAPLVSTSNLTPTGTTTSGSSTISGVSAMAGIAVGQPITGTGIAAYSYITAVAGSDITLNQNAIASGTVTLTIPSVPTLNDVAIGGVDNTNNLVPFFLVYARNGASQTDPLKGGVMMDVFPGSYLQTTESGPLKLADINGDGALDLLNFSPTSGFLASYLSTLTGNPIYSLGASIDGNYLANPSGNGCPNEATDCLPDPMFTSLGVNQGFPYSWYTQNMMAVTDFNNDGIPDVVVTGYLSRGISVALGSEDGVMVAPTIYSAGSGADIRPVGVVAADFDQDGFQDIAITGINLSGTQTGFVSWLKGNGDGTFQTAEFISTILSGSTDPRAISAADLDGDGRPEIATLHYSAQTVWVGRRHSNGTWILQTGPTINTAGGTNGISMKWGRTSTSTAVGLDVVIGGLDISNSIRIITGVSLSVTNTSTGSFTLTSAMGAYRSLGGFLGDIDIADLNADGYGDVVVGMQTSSGGSGTSGVVYTCMYTGVGTCTPIGWGMEGYNTTGVTAGDVTGDGLPEIFVGHRLSNRLINRSVSRMLNLSQ